MKFLFFSWNPESGHNVNKFLEFLSKTIPRTPFFSPFFNKKTHDLQTNYDKKSRKSSQRKAIPEFWLLCTCFCSQVFSIFSFFILLSKGENRITSKKKEKQEQDAVESWWEQKNKWVNLKFSWCTWFPWMEIFFTRGALSAIPFLALSCWCLSFYSVFETPVWLSCSS